MTEQRQNAIGGGKKAKPAPNCLSVGQTPTGRRVAGDKAARSRRLSQRKSANTRHPAAILAGLPADVMDECVADMAEAVIAMLFAGEQTETDDDDTSDHLRQV